MSILDDVDQIRTFDPANMYNSIFDFPEQIADALKVGKLWQLNPSEFLGIKNIVVIGMGGSAIGAELLRSFLSTRLLVPFDICRHYVLPEYVDDETLVIASSYSGNTEETLSAIDDAIKRKAMLVAISTGGLLGDLAKLNDIPLAKLPTGLQPRAALGLNPAKLLAEKMHQKVVIIYTGPTLTDAVGLRWKGQLCENSKNMSYTNQFSEFNHNELVAWSETIEQHKDHLMVVILRDMDDHTQIRQRMNIAKDIIQSREVEVIDVHSRGERPLERMLSLVQLGDFVSYYLAILNKVDPTPVNVIEAMKQALRNSR